MSLLSLIGCALALLPTKAAFSGSGDVQNQTYSKATIEFTRSNFTVSYGQTKEIYAKGTPGRLLSKFTFTSVPSNAITLSVGQPVGSSLLISAKSNVVTCSTYAAITASFAGSPVKSISGTILVPTGEYAALQDSGYCLPVGCYFHDYDVLLNAPAGLNLDGVLATEELSSKQTVGGLPNCPFGAPQGQAVPLAKSQSTGLWGVNDYLRIPGGSISEDCADRYSQTVRVGSCTVQVNTLTFYANISGTRNITRSDE